MSESFSGRGDQTPDSAATAEAAGLRDAEPIGESDELVAARAALKRAQAAAAGQGLRPGSRPQARRVRATDAFSTPVRKRGARDPQVLGSTMKRMLEERGWDVDVAAGAVMARWADFVGVDVARHVQPVAFEHGVLTVRAESTAWATQVSLLASKLLAQIESGIGEGVVRELKVVGPAVPSWVRGPRRVAGRGPRDTYG